MAPGSKSLRDPQAGGRQRIDRHGVLRVGADLRAMRRLQQRIAYQFHDLGLLERALSHRSMAPATTNGSSFWVMPSSDSRWLTDLYQSVSDASENQLSQDARASGQARDLAEIARASCSSVPFSARARGAAQRRPERATLSSPMRSKQSLPPSISTEDGRGACPGATPARRPSGGPDPRDPAKDPKTLCGSICSRSAGLCRATKSLTSAANNTTRHSRDLLDNARRKRRG